MSYHLRNFAYNQLSVVNPVQAEKAQKLLKFNYTILPILAGADKFLNLTTDWKKYLSPKISRALPLTSSQIMQLVGAVEIAGGLLVSAKPELGSKVIAGWLTLIIGNLLLLGDHYDIAVRDFGLALGALALSNLSS